MRAIIVVISLILFSMIPVQCLLAQEKTVEQWDYVEWTKVIDPLGNPFKYVKLQGVFQLGNRSDTVSGFYDGYGVFRIRYMPDTPGKWTFRTISNQVKLDGFSGNFNCVPASAGNHGMVKVDPPYHFKYADGKSYHPFGTTLYSWTHQGDSLEQLTLRTLSRSPFNKVRMCIFPKRYDWCENEPEYYPYALRGRTDSGFTWDHNYFDPRFFQHLEKRIIELGKMGIEADLILFHPYDKGHWGFDRLAHEDNIAYLRYVIARFSAFKNVWWSVANEFDLVKTKQLWEWDSYVDLLHKEDPYGHLVSVHHSMEYYDVRRPGITHASIQNESLVQDFGRAGTLKDVYKKPVIYDEVGYEGNTPRRWGNLKAEELVHHYWQAILAGTYVTHGETYLDPNDVIWWARGGVIKGRSPERISYLRRMIDSTGTFDYIDKWRNDHVSITSDRRHILIYFGRERTASWKFMLPAKTGLPDGTRFRAEVIDTWGMSKVSVPAEYRLKKTGDYTIADLSGASIPLTGKPYLAILLTRVD